MNRLRELRKKTGLSLRELEDKVGISYSNIASIERGETQLKEDTAMVFAKFYNVSVDYILGVSDNIIPNDNNVSVAFYNQHGIVSDEQKKEIEGFIEYIKHRDGK